MSANASNPATTILVADDNEGNLALARSTLEDEGFRVVVARNGVEAVAAFSRESPDCILLDVRMPEMDGFAAATHIRALPGGPETPVVFFTALRDVDTFDRALVAGGDDFLTKPVRPAELVLRVESALKTRRMSTELREHYGLLKRQRDDLMRLQLQKERLTAFVVHDLKNPVNSMDLHAQVLLREKGLPESAYECAAQIRTDARQLTRLIMNLLDVSKADEGQLAPRRADVDLRRVVDDVKAEMEASAKARGVRLASDLAVERVHADEDLLRRTLTNLVENATRYSPRETTVTVSSARVPEGVLLRVADQGRGVPPEMREKVFSAFVQVESGHDVASRGSRGLGLTFCKVVAEAHGGKIWVEDGAPGAVFCLRLPDGP